MKACLHILICVVLAAMAACASTPTTEASANPEPEASDDAPRGVQRWTGLRERVERAGQTADCNELPNEPTEAGWIRAWCAYHVHDWRSLTNEARRAQRYFAEAGQIRRSAEAWLLVGLAEAELGNTADAVDAVERAAKLVEWGELAPIGPTADPYAGDLAFLEAAVVARGFPVPRGASRTDRSELLSLSVDAAKRRGMRSRAAHRLRELGPARLDAGRVRGSLEALSEALAIELRDENEAGIEATLQVSAELAARLGVPEVRAWLSGADHDLADAVLPGQPDFSSVMRLRTTDHGRRELARKIAAYRSSPSARLRPDERLVELLLDPETLRYCRGRSWAFTFHSGLLLRDVGAFEESRRYLESSVETIESTRATIPDTALRQRFFSGKRVAYESLVEHYVGIATADRPQTDVRRAYAIANATKARGLLDLLDGVADPEMTIAPTARWQPTSSMKTRGETLQARLRLWVNRPVPRNDKPDPFAELHTFVPNQRHVRIVEYILAERVGFVFVAGPGGLEVRKIPGRAEMGARVRRHAELLRDPKADPAELRAVSERLYVDLIAPIQDLVVGAKRLIVAPDAAIEQVEFAALATPSRDRRPKWLIDEFAVSYVPSTAVARRIAARRTPVSKGSLLLGDPNLERSGLALASLSDAAADVAFDRLDARFRPLPGARREVDSIASYAPKPSRARTGAAATESLVLRPRVIPLELLHIAAHGVADGQSGLSFEQPAILLARADGAPRDGILTLEEILVLKPRARVVTLSGCETGVGWQSLGDGAFGLAGAFLFAGSEVVVASRWQVEDAATQRLMKSFYGNRKKGEAEALRRAQRALSKRLPPFYWASFRVFGDLH